MDQGPDHRTERAPAEAATHEDSRSAGAADTHHDAWPCLLGMGQHAGHLGHRMGRLPQGEKAKREQAFTKRTTTPDDCEFVFDAHHAFVFDDGHPEPRRAHACGVGMPRDASRVAKYTKVPIESLKCTCGQPSASAAHLTFECPDRPDRQFTGPTTQVAARILLQYAPRRPRWQGHCLDYDGVAPETISRINAAGGHKSFNREAVIATDGGAATGWRAAWAASVTTDRGIITFGAPITGLDVSPGAAEAWAVLGALRWASQAIAPDTMIRMIIDNLNVVRALQRGEPDPSAPLHEIWASIFDKIQDRDIQTHWIPSHAKRPTWRPPEPYADMCKMWRDLNSASDAKCTEIIDALPKDGVNAAKIRDQAAKWSRRSLCAEARATVAWINATHPWQ